VISFQSPDEAIVYDIARVHVQCWQQAYVGLMDADFLRDLSVENRAEIWRNTISDQQVFSRIVLDDNNIIGFVSSGPSRSSEVADGELYAIYVLASHYGKGIGSTLFKFAQNDWHKRGGQRLLANVFTGNSRANAFYHYMGGEIVEQKLIEMGGTKLIENVFVFNKDILTPSPNRG
jgi:GNAT superfamily N-acetyltransferase